MEVIPSKTEKLNEQKLHSPWANAPHVYQKLVIYAAVNYHNQLHLSANKEKKNLKSMIKLTAKVSMLFT